MARTAGSAARTARTARTSGSGLSTIPGPPPKGMSSTWRWRSSVWSRRSWAHSSRVPLSSARPTTPTPSGPGKTPGKMVSTSTRTSGLLPGADHHDAAGEVHPLDEGPHHGQPKPLGAVADHQHLVGGVPLHVLDHTDRSPRRGHGAEPHQLMDEPLVVAQGTRVARLDAEVGVAQGVGGLAAGDALQGEQQVTVAGRPRRRHHQGVAAVLDAQPQPAPEARGITPQRLDAQLAAHAVGTAHVGGADQRWRGLGRPGHGDHRLRDVDLDALTVAQPGGPHHRADGVDVAAALADDLAHVVGADLDLDHRLPAAGAHPDGDRLLVDDDVGRDEAGEVSVVGHASSSVAAGPVASTGSTAAGLAGASGSATAVAPAAWGRGARWSTPCCSSSLRAMSLGWAPLRIQSRTRSASMDTF